MLPIMKEESCAKLRRIIHMETLEVMTQELEILNLSTEGSQQELHHRLLRFHLNESFSDVVRMQLNLSYGTIFGIDFKLAMDNAHFDWVSVSNEGKTIDVNMKSDEREQSIGGESQCETCRLYSQNPTDTSHRNTEKDQSENNDKELTDYQVSCLSLLRDWFLSNPYLKDETPKDFLGNLTDLRKLVIWDDKMLLKMLPHVLWPSIKSWYRTKDFNSWQEFELSFLEEYGSKQSDFPKSSDSMTETTTPDQTATKPVVAASVSQSIQQDKESDNIEQVSRWECIKKLKFLGLKFNGQKGSPAATFMNNLNDFRSYTRVNDRALLDVLSTVFDNNTKSWYRAQTFTSWQDFETAFKSTFDPQTNANIIKPKPVNLAALSHPLHYNDNNSTNVNDSCTIGKSLNQVMIPKPFNSNHVLQIQKPSIPNQPNHTNNLLPVSSQHTAMPSYSINDSCTCGKQNCSNRWPSSVFPSNSQSSHSSSQPSCAHDTLHSSLFSNTLPSVEMTSRIDNACNKLFYNQNTSYRSVATTAESTVNQGSTNWTGYKM